MFGNRTEKQQPKGVETLAKQNNTASELRRQKKEGSTGLLSVIVPVYNVQSFLEDCLAGLAKLPADQTEIILVDDGSTDDSGAVCDQWAEKYPNFGVIHQKNQGLSAARNTGINAARGEYIAFTDSDDRIVPEVFAEALKILRTQQADLIQFGYVQGEPEASLPAANLDACRLVQIMQDPQEIMNALLEGEIQQVVWNKIYRMPLAKTVLFEAGKLHEDEFWTWKVLAQSSKVCLMPAAGYFYTVRAGSIMQSKFSRRRLDAVDARLERLAYLQKKYPKLYAKGYRDVYFLMLYLLQQALNTPDFTGREIKQLFDPLFERLRQMPAPAANSSSDRVWMTLGLKAPVVCGRLRNALKIGNR